MFEAIVESRLVWLRLFVIELRCGTREFCQSTLMVEKIKCDEKEVDLRKKKGSKDVLIPHQSRESLCSERVQCASVSESQHNVVTWATISFHHLRGTAVPQS